MTPTAQEIIERVKARYAGCRTYQDEGEQATRFTPLADGPLLSHTKRIRFRMAYQRSGRFLFEYREVDLDPEAESVHGAVWTDTSGVHKWWSLKTPGETDGDLDHALGVFQGVSGRTSSEIPSLLFTETKLQSRIAFLGTAGLWPSATCEKVECLRIAGARPQQGSTMVVWIEERTGLVRRLDEKREITPEFTKTLHEDSRRRLIEGGMDVAKAEEMLRPLKQSSFQPHSTETTTVWHPRMDHDIDPKVFEFTPPG